MKITFVSRNAYPVMVPESRAVFGGSEVLLARAARYFARKGHRIAIVVGDFGQADRISIEETSLLKGWWRERPSPSVVNFGSIFKFLWVSLMTGADVYIIRGASMELGLLRLIKMLTGRKLVFMVASNTDLDENFAAKGLMRRIYWWGLYGADLVVCQNAFQTKQLDLERIEVIGNWHQIPETLWQKAATGTVSWVGTSQALKRPGLVVKLAKALPWIKVRMVLSAHDKSVYKKVTKEASLLKNLTIYPRLSQSEAEKIIKGTDVLINTSEYEGVPNTFIEAAKWGVPIISLKADMGKRMLDKSGAGISCGDNWELFVKEIEELLTDKVKREKMGRAAYAWARDNFEMNTNLTRLESLLIQLIEQ